MLPGYKIHVFLLNYFLQQGIILIGFISPWWIGCVALRPLGPRAIATASVWNISGWWTGKEEYAKVMLCHLKLLFSNDVFHWQSGYE